MALCRTCAMRACRSILRSRIASRNWPSTAFIRPPLSRSAPESRRSFATGVLQAEEFKNELKRPPDTSTQARDGPSSGPLAPVTGASALEWAVKKQLQHLSDDPFKIAQHVQATLAKGRYEEALLLTRKASKNRNLAVSWNHLIEHQMRAQRLHAAIKLYNEMKKRAQLPNAQTYTIIFNGCAMSNHSRLAVSESLKIYHSMINSERLPPNTAHLNAVLKVCARADDIDSMFSLLQTLDGKLRIPDSVTYTTILNALRVKEKDWRRLPNDAGEPASEIKAQRDSIVGESINRAQAVWDDVMDSWRRGRIVVDEQLVCTMGRILTTGDAKANDKVLSLVEQTMGIRRMDSDSARERKKIRSPSDRKGPEADLAAAGAEPTAPLQHAKPGRNVLSLILESIGATRKTSLAPKYWDLIVQEHGVVPDSENWFRLLRTLDICKASTKAVDYLERMPKRFVQPETLRLVMKTCVRENLNIHSYENAVRVLKVMRETGRDPDEQVLRLFIRAAIANLKRDKADALRGTEEGGIVREAMAKQIEDAIDKIWVPLNQATNHLRPPNLGAEPPRSPDAAREYNKYRELAAVARWVIRAIDVVLTREAIAGEATLKKLKVRRAVLDRYVHDFYLEREAREPRLRTTSWMNRQSREEEAKKRKEAQRDASRRPRQQSEEIDFWA